MAEHTLTPDELAMIDATVARVAAERADAQIMGAKYDAACEQIVKLLDEAAAQRARIAELEQAVSRLDQLAEVRGQRAARADSLERALREDREEAAAELAEQAAEIDRLQALADRRWVAWTSARRRASQQRDALREALVDDRDQARRVRDRYRDERNAARAEIADLRAQLAATTRPEAALDRLAADARPTAGGGQ